jgi:phenylalanyl-tRNA synthetase beta chain
MNVSLRWLEAFLRRPLDSRDVVEKLAMLGAPVDVVEQLHAGLASIVVGRVLEVTPHPNPKITKVRMTLVDDGTGAPLAVACGAANVTPGKLYPFARVGTRVPGGKKGPLEIGARAIGGVTSHGMLCSLDELGLGTDSEGIWELDADAAPGTPLLDAVPLADERLVVDVTPNRPDLLCHKGIARELAYAYAAPFRLPAIPGAERLDVPPARRCGAEATVGGVRVAIEDADGCPRFLGAVVRNVTVAPSPEWLRRRVEAAGMRSINNVVDATNYVLLELNQPTHAYDVARLRGPEVAARRGRTGERIVTLDGTERAVTPEMVVIADAGGVIGVAGVMGGAESEVRSDTRDIFLECASFAPSRIRRARRALGMSTEASYRFERGVDRWAAPDALRRCLELFLTLTGGTLAEAPVDLWPAPSHPPRIFLRLSRVAQVLGVELTQHAVESYLVAIGATVVAKPEDGRLAVDVPGWRPDLVSEIDLVEEVARLHGYDAFPIELRPFRVGSLADAPAHVAADAVRSGLAGLGLLEASTLPFAREGNDAGVRVENPLSAEDAFLRERLLPGLAREVERNWAAGTRDVRLFEIGTVFGREAAGARPLEATHVAAVLTGALEPPHWAGPAPADADVWELKGLAERVVALAYPSASVQVEGAALVGRTADGRTVGWAGPLVADAPPWAAPLFGVEVALDPAPRHPPQYQALPTTPSSERVLALLLATGTSAANVVAALRGAGEPLLESVDVVSDYRGADLPAGMRSVAFRLTFRAADRTLSAGEVDAAEARLLGALEATGIRRRGAPATVAAEVQ